MLQLFLNDHVAQKNFDFVIYIITVSESPVCVFFHCDIRYIFPKFQIEISQKKGFFLIVWTLFYVSV